VVILTGVLTAGVVTGETDVGTETEGTMELDPAATEVYGTEVAGILTGIEAVLVVPGVQSKPTL
jgi:hypothetical protein